jgi:hypothetical protein
VRVTNVNCKHSKNGTTANSARAVSRYGSGIFAGSSRVRKTSSLASRKPLTRLVSSVMIDGRAIAARHAGGQRQRSHD